MPVPAPVRVHRQASSARLGTGPAIPFHAAGREVTVSDQELRRTLEDLRRELAGVEDVDAELEELLEGIRTDIDAVIEKAPPHTLPERLADAIERFEATHPALASAMGAVADQLARLGI